MVSIKRRSKIRSKLFITTDVRATGLKSFSSFGFGFLGIGIIIEDFHLSGTIARDNEELNILVKGGDSSLANNFRVLGLIESEPHALFALTRLSVLRVSSTLMLMTASLSFVCTGVGSGFSNLA